MSNKRILDSAIWRSSKLRNLPNGFALHYANWIPLAAANGVFEADTALIHSTIYAYMMPSIPVETVEDILLEFERAGLVRLFQARAKRWGYFIGIEKAGRLPELRYLSRYKDLPPSPPIQESEEENLD